MENAAHTLAGLALARLGFDRYGPSATVTLVLASNLPDLDVIGTAWGGQPWYLCHHRGLTHAIPGLLVQGLLLGLLVFAAGRRRPQPPHLLPLLFAAWAGLLLHLGMDGLNNYGIRPWLPFDATWFYGDLVFIVDPWLWLTLGTAACLGSPSPRRGLGFALFALVAGGVLWSTDRAPRAVAVVWSLAMGLVVLLRWRRTTCIGRRRYAAWGAAATLLYLLGLLLLQQRARALVDAAAPAHLVRDDHIETRSLVARPGVPWRFGALAQSARHLYRFDIDVVRGAVVLDEVQERHLDDPWIARMRDTVQHHAWRVFARHPFAARWQGDLVLGDGRYARDGRPSWSNLRVPAAATAGD